MSLRLEMLQVARLAPAAMGSEAAGLVEAFVRSRQAPDGGFRGKAEASDLYYTSFAIDALSALQAGVPAGELAAYLDRHLARLDALDFVHLCCLARLLSSLPPEERQRRDPAPVLDGIERCRSADGGYQQVAGADSGSAYACFLACGAYADHGLSLPAPEGVLRCLESLSSPEGAWSNDSAFPVPNVPATAAAITVLRQFRQPVPERSAAWILGAFHPESGGFLPFPGAPLPDLLSTAVALHALDGLQAPFAALKEPLLDFIDSLWSAAGGFHGTWEDDDLDVEYTYYGLLALGHLAL